MRGEELLPLAAVTGAHGLSGELRLKLFNPESELLQSLTHVSVMRPDAEGSPRRIEIESIRRHKGSLLLRLSGCRDRDAALALRGCQLCVRRDELPELEPGEYYLVDLVGLEARTPAGELVGHIEEVLEYPSAQAVRVRTVEGELEIPNLPPYVVEVQLDQGRIIVDALDELPR
ncbi:MAG: ribosome maturation factor RimM [Myxococcales bacterium]|nr:ribosome maturation factor RimM [Myxococcales bacterium]